MLVGDSIMRNQWESLVCLAESVIPAESKMLSSHGPTMAFHAMVKTIFFFLLFSIYIQCEIF